MAANATNRIYSILKEKINNGELSPSETLIESELATEYQVSRNTIRKVLLMLVNESLVVTEPNKSAKIRSYSLKEVLEFLEVRSLLEAYIIEITTPIISEAAIRQLSKILEGMYAAKSSTDLMEYSRLNQQFHSTIYNECPNKTLVDTTMHLKSQMRKYNAKTIMVPHRDEASFKEHQDIYNAVKNRDGKEAKECIHVHMENVSKTFKDYYTILF